MHRIQILKEGTWPSTAGELAITPAVLSEVLETYNPAVFKSPLAVTHDLEGVLEKDLPALDLSETKVVFSPKGLSYGAPDKLEKRADGGVDALFKNISPLFVNWAKKGNLLSVSPGLYRPEDKGNPYPGKWALRHIAGLGTEPPAQKGMDPLTSGLVALSEYGEGDGGVSVLHRPVASAAPVKEVNLSEALRDRAQVLLSEGGSDSTSGRAAPVNLAESVKAALKASAAKHLVKV